jgi:zinc protease
MKIYLRTSFTALFLLLVSFSEASSLQDIKFEKYTLPNGLDVILHEDHSIPMVAVNVWYHVGSKNEKVGRTGFAHLFEHMMFQGSKHHDKDYFEPLQKVGGSVNGSTTEDRTNYWENVPTNYLEVALWLEADRMGFLLPAMTKVKLDNQRDVVKNERRQSLENQPYAKAYDLIPSLLYPRDHPYSWPVIGSMEDLSAASLEDVSEFFKTYYTPNNASLCIAGDFNPAVAKKLVEKYFAPIPAGPPVDRLQVWTPQLDGIRRAVQEDQVSLPRVFMAWHSPAWYSPGDAEVDILSGILTFGKTSRLYKALVYDQQIAQDVQAAQISQEISSAFLIQATAREGHTLEELEKAIDAELNQILAKGITQEELTQLHNTSEAQSVRSLALIGGFGGRADRLNEYNTLLGDPGKFQWDLDRFLKATTANVLDYAKQTLDLNRRVILHVVPQGKLTPKETQLDRSVQPKGAPEPSFAPPKIQRTKLSNGLSILLAEDHKLPLVQLNMVLKSGWAADPKDRPGAGALTAELLDEGTKNLTAIEISKAAQAIGANLGTASSFDGSVVQLNVLKKHFDNGLSLMSDIILNPTFPAEELERQRKIYLGRIQQEAKDPGIAARKTFLRVLYGPEHPYGQPCTGSGTESSIKAIQREDLLKYYNANYLPNNATVVIAGDITLEEAKAKLESAFRTWRSGDISQNEIPPPPQISRTKIYLVDKPSAAQSVIYAGNLGIRRNDPDYIAAQVLNRAFGGKFTSRINMNLREDKGYSYGSRSSFMDARGVGAFFVSAPVQTQSTKESVVEIIKELHDVSEKRPLTEDELADAKDNLMKGFPQQFQTLPTIAGLMAELVLYDLPDDYWVKMLNEINAVTAEIATKAAKDHLHPDQMLLVIVGDRQKIEPKIRELNLGEIEFFDPAKL